MAKKRDPRTIAAANGVAADRSFGAVAPAVYLSTTFQFEAFGRSRGHDYSRTSNPTRDMLAQTLAELEGGAGAVVVSSGMAAIDLVLSQLQPGGAVVAPHDCYGGTHRLLTARHQRRQIDVTFVDQSDMRALDRALECSPELVFIETPSNPLMRVVDICALSARARRAGAKVVVDNTFLSPALQQPLRLGADFVVHSTTKFINGHSDVVGGAVIAADKGDAEVLAAWSNVVGVAGSPFDCYLTLRGVRTLFPRMAQQQQNALAIARHLQEHRQVRAVHYPGLRSHPGHSLAKQQQSGFGAMLSFELDGGSEAARALVDRLRIFTLAESLGGVESLISHPVTMTHASMDADARRQAGITDGLLRISVGLEAEEDLISDLDLALQAAASSVVRPRAASVTGYAN